MERVSKLNGEKARYIFTSSHQGAGQNRNVKMTNKSLENVTEFMILGRWCHEELHSYANKDSISYGRC